MNTENKLQITFFSGKQKRLNRKIDVNILVIIVINIVLGQKGGLLEYNTNYFGVSCKLVMVKYHDSFQ